MNQYLIRTNVEDEGWTNDGIFGRTEAVEKIEAFLSEHSVRDIRVLFLGAHRPTPVELTSVSARRASDEAWGYNWLAGVTRIFFTRNAR